MLRDADERGITIVQTAEDYWHHQLLQLIAKDVNKYSTIHVPNSIQIVNSVFEYSFVSIAYGFWAEQSL